MVSDSHVSVMQATSTRLVPSLSDFAMNPPHMFAVNIHGTARRLTGRSPQCCVMLSLIAGMPQSEAFQKQTDRLIRPFTLAGGIPTSISETLQFSSSQVKNLNTLYQVVNILCLDQFRLLIMAIFGSFFVDVGIAWSKMTTVLVVHIQQPGSHGRGHKWLKKAEKWPAAGLCPGPTLFNLYTNDLPATKCQKFIYADDICLGTQAHTFVELECTLTTDMARWQNTTTDGVSSRASPKQFQVSTIFTTLALVMPSGHGRAVQPYANIAPTLA